MSRVGGWGIPTLPGMSPGGRLLRLEHGMHGGSSWGPTRGQDQLEVRVCRRLYAAASHSHIQT